MPFENDDSVLQAQNVCVDIDKITPEILEKPKKLYSLIYGQNFMILLESTKRMIDLQNSKFPDPKQTITKVTENQLIKYFATRILLMLLRGKHVDFYILYEMFNSKEMNVFRIIKKDMSKISFLPRTR